ncbi:MAG TPA: CRISPR-associated endoribonuclease Cas6 [Cyanobacteria bacterium UBA11149]|nr:CRISPR-associated endoribonuclease Cas6 [Cyanobacteria bacterium UBA11367]HBE60791.1 CRISPR-associated endoribonuclease Cas6 [Cyanobacteria bacterium UBA11366]HBK66422.1 CRISPR-associated endoribonuclease Cas6 [Cyanobacteria bacterium UBA11166]HBR73645.1 CRISPR-associated endoribonuclease Cas6 [Cyanobacteria bacterium UBA11159]HBS72196.1 CRISPR-associated endoribonuclease Cas6 [Cyanobacteria bacterium UBA11153]HBW90268.1 CRISPR-associated endoribonuclease Cas6 [Cyanobacteria bacterium UBA11
MNIQLKPNTQLVGLIFAVIPQKTATLYPQYTTTLHAWFLDKVRLFNPELSAFLHDAESKPFTISGFAGEIATSKGTLQLVAGKTYHWRITAFSQTVVDWMRDWLSELSPIINLRYSPLEIQSIAFSLPPTTYSQLYQTEIEKTLTLSFTSPTSFRRKGHHFPLPLPVNVFHSYLRRWQEFSGIPIDDEAGFLTWIDESVIITRHQLESVKVAAGKQGKVTGFIGSIEYSLTNNAYQKPEFVQLFFTLGKFAPYCGTGHKTPFGLGQTSLGWSMPPTALETLLHQTILAKRIEELTTILMANQKRKGGERATNVCQTRATILARQERGESLIDIAADLDMPYQTVKTYVKLARRVLNMGNETADARSVE